jgi:hypothetical protein
MCPKCSNFTNAPVSQKRRRCSYCGTIIEISKANRALYDNPDQAQAAVKVFNAARGGDEFQKSVEQSQTRLRSFLPDEPVDIEKIATDDEQVTLPGKRTRLMAVLESEAKERPCALDRLEQVCNDEGLSWAWVEKTIQDLSNAGALIFPRPWEVQLVETTEETSQRSTITQDISKEIISYLKTCKEKVRVIDIVRHFQDIGISEDSVNKSLDRLLRGGNIFQPVVGYISLV